MKRNKDYFRGCLLGGAIGDALGWPVEFMTAEEIKDQY
ncbi:ADP-ribosylglycohydrolase [Desulfitispora alkaliphila]